MNIEKPEERGVVLSEEKIKQLVEQPIIKSSIRKSNDGKWIIHKTVMVDIKPVGYFKKCLAQELVESV